DPAVNRFGPLAVDVPHPDLILRPRLVERQEPDRHRPAEADRQGCTRRQRWRRGTGSLNAHRTVEGTQPEPGTTEHVAREEAPWNRLAVEAEPKRLAGGTGGHIGNAPVSRKIGRQELLGRLLAMGGLADDRQPRQVSEGAQRVRGEAETAV